MWQSIRYLLNYSRTLQKITGLYQAIPKAVQITDIRSVGDEHMANGVSQVIFCKCKIRKNDLVLHSWLRF